MTSKIIVNSSFEEVKEVLRKVMMKVGIRASNLPTEIEKLVLYEHIVEHFGGNRLNEISLAFDMAITGKLHFGDGESAIPYENFSCLYFSTVMTAYQKWASQVYRQIEKPAEAEQKIFTQDQLDDSAREDAERQYQWFLGGSELKGLGHNKAILEKDGLLNEGENVIEFFKRKAESGSTNIYIRVQD